MSDPRPLFSVSEASALLATGMDWLPATVGIVILIQEAAEVLSDADDAGSSEKRPRCRVRG
jgi:hypothetical protein